VELNTGVLAQLEVEGVTDTPDFSLDTIGSPVPLHTEFSATVNGTNGDTQLHPVNALLAHSLIIAEGSVERVTGAPGHLISINASVPNGRIQDFLKLATRSEKSILSGPVKIKAKLTVPPGTERALERAPGGRTRSDRPADSSGKALANSYRLEITFSKGL
jgi:hypothetical protein